MWKQILTKVNASLLANWSQLVWFVLGTILGVFLLGGLVSCQAIDGTKSAVGSVDGTLRDIPVIGRVYAIPSDVVGGVYTLGEDVVNGAVEVVVPTKEKKK